MAKLFPGLAPERTSNEPFYKTLALLRKRSPKVSSALLRRGFGQLNTYSEKLAADGKKCNWNDKGAYIFREGNHFVDKYAPQFLDYITKRYLFS